MAVGIAVQTRLDRHPQTSSYVKIMTSMSMITWLKQLQKDFLNTFPNGSRQDYQRDVVEVGGTLEEFYNHCEDALR